MEGGSGGGSGGGSDWPSLRCGGDGYCRSAVHRVPAHGWGAARGKRASLSDRCCGRGRRREDNVLLVGITLVLVAAVVVVSAAAATVKGC